MYQAAIDSVKASVAQARTMADPHKAMQTVSEAWAKFAAIPAVASALASAKPVVEKGTTTFTKVGKWVSESI